MDMNPKNGYERNHGRHIINVTVHADDLVVSSDSLMLHRTVVCVPNPTTTDTGFSLGCLGSLIVQSPVCLGTCCSNA